MIVSTLGRSDFIPSSALRSRRTPSNLNGLVTTATVSASISCATSAITSAAPVPVPPPIQAVMKTISAPSRAFRISALLSSADARPDAGSPPAPRPLA